MYKPHTVCRACGLGSQGPSTLKISAAAGEIYKGPEALIPVFDLGIQPLANDFCGGSEERSGYAPLKVLYCPRCDLGQLSVTVSPNILYAHNYAYVTSTSQTMKDHFGMLTRDLLEQAGRKCPVLEIGSNDGTLLAHFRDQGFPIVMGIDPAQNLALEAKKKDVTTLCAMFGREAARTAKSSMGTPGIILARHCFCHIDNWREFIQSCEALCDERTVVAIEVPYAHDMLAKNEFDTVYHEHLSYLSLKSVQYLLANSTLQLTRVIEYSIHGGALLLILRKIGHPVHESVGRMLKAERCGRADWQRFSNQAELKIMELSALVRNLATKGKIVAGYGASAKSTVWISACGFDKQQIKFISDTTKGKWYKNSPGTGIPIVDDGALTRDLPDYAVLFAWNYEKECIAKEQIFLDKGGTWIIPSPAIRLVSKTSL